MTRQQMYRELEKLYCNTDWSNSDSVKHYTELAHEYRKAIADQEEKEREAAQASFTVTAKRTLKNTYDQVLFIGGKQYKAHKEGKRFYIFNELHTETPVRTEKLNAEFTASDVKTERR